MILVDTSTLLWLILDPSCLSVRAKESIREHESSLALSGITAFEIARLVKKRKITLPLPPQRWFYGVLDQLQIEEIPLTSELMFMAEDLPDFHHDPADRLIMATAIAYRMPIITADRMMAQYPNVQIIW